MVLREDPLQGFLEHLHGQVAVALRREKLTDEKLERFGGDRDCTPVLRLKEHLEEAVAQVVYVLLDQELALIFSIVGQLGPFEQSLERLAVCLHSKPDADHD